MWFISTNKQPISQ